MIQDITTITQARQPERCNLLLHCGSSAVERGQLHAVPTPRPTRTWRPIPHHTLLETVSTVLSGEGIDISGEAHGLSDDGARYFGLLEVRPHRGENEAHRVIGLRNSHDKRFSAGIVAGSQVLVCDNLCFAGEVALARKHTTRILDQLPSLVLVALSVLRHHWALHHARMERYQEVPLNDPQAHDLLIRAVDNGVCANATIPRVLEGWREPHHEAFEPRTVWSLQNAFTEAFKGKLDQLPDRTMRLHRLLDSYCTGA